MKQLNILNTPTMASVQSEFTEKAKKVLEAQTAKQIAAEDKAKELAKKVAKAELDALSHKEEAQKAGKFIENISKLFE